LIVTRTVVILTVLKVVKMVQMGKAATNAMEEWGAAVSGAQ
jgi:hypothetical protein